MTIRVLDLFFFRVKLTFIKLKQAFIKAPIVYYFDLKYYIKIKIDASGCTISRILNQMTLDNLG